MFPIRFPSAHSGGFGGGILAGSNRSSKQIIPLVGQHQPQNPSHGRSTGKAIGPFPPQTQRRSHFPAILAQNRHFRLDPAPDGDGGAERDSEDARTDLQPVEVQGFGHLRGLIFASHPVCGIFWLT